MGCHLNWYACKGRWKYTFGNIVDFCSHSWWSPSTSLLLSCQEYCFYKSNHGHNHLFKITFFFLCHNLFWNILLSWVHTYCNEMKANVNVWITVFHLRLTHCMRIQWVWTKAWPACCPDQSPFENVWWIVRRIIIKWWHGVVKVKVKFICIAHFMYKTIQSALNKIKAL